MELIKESEFVDNSNSLESLLFALVDHIGLPQKDYSIVSAMNLPLMEASPRDFKHEMRAAILSCISASVLGLDNEQQRDALIAAFTHDIGKYKIDQKILSKLPSKPLSHDEMASMKKHVLYSYQIVHPYYHMPGEYVLRHHTQNSAPYPHHLNPLRGKIQNLQLSMLIHNDNLDAMTSRQNGVILWEDGNLNTQKTHKYLVSLKPNLRELSTLLYNSGIFHYIPLLHQNQTA